MNPLLVQANLWNFFMTSKLHLEKNVRNCSHYLFIIHSSIAWKLRLTYLETYFFPLFLLSNVPIMQNFSRNRSIYFMHGLWLGLWNLFNLEQILQVKKFPFFMNEENLLRFLTFTHCKKLLKFRGFFFSCMWTINVTQCQNKQNQGNSV